MKTLNIKNMVPAAALLLTLGMGSCVNDLDVTPINPSSTTEVDNDALFNKCYAAMAVAGNGGANGDCDIDGLDGGTTGFVRQMFNANELTTDEAICGWGDPGISSFCFNQYTSNHPMLTGYYNRLYFGISMCNHYLEVCSGASDQELRNAEVRFLRAWYYYQLMDCYANVPFATAVSSEAAKQIQRADLFDWIEDEILAVEPTLSDAKPKKSTDSGYGRVDKAAAWMLLSRMYLNAEVYTGSERYSDAVTYSKKVMDSAYKINTTSKGVFSAYQMLFLGDNGETDAAYEAIFPLLQDGITTTSFGTSLFMMAGCFDADMTRGDDLGLGGTNGTTDTWGGNRARKDLVMKFFNSEADVPLGTTSEIIAKAGDDRALFWGDGHTLSTDDVATFKSGFGVAKFLNYYSSGAAAHNAEFPDMDYFLMRKAEAYLTYAEALTRAAGATNAPAEAVAAINVLRARANATQRSNYSLDDILDEWSREFYFEGRRRVDLVRFGYFGGINDYKWEWKGGSYSGASFSENLNIFAIPYDDLSVNKNLTQNPGY